MSPTANVIPLPTTHNLTEAVVPPLKQSRSEALKKGALRAFEIRNVCRLEDAFHAVVVLVLIAIAGLVLYHTTHTLFDDLGNKQENFSQVTTSAVSGVLFAIIIMEVMRTVMAHIERPGLDLEPFLIIGIISAVREILSVGARMSLLPDGEGARGVIHLSLLELGVNGVLVFGLAMSLVMVRRLAGPRTVSADDSK
jgi:uncharacterized membrane protein (DUF373 family)